MNSNLRPLAVVTGASSGIGLGVAVECAKHGFDLILAADRPLEEAARQVRAAGATAATVVADLATPEGVEQLYAEIGGRPVAALVANAGHGLGKGFLDQDFAAIIHVIDTNITGTLALIHRVGNDMRAQGSGRILITGSIAGFMPGTFQAVYNGSKAFIDSFSWALRNELKDTGITVDLSDAGTDRNRFLCTRRHDGYQGRRRPQDGCFRSRAHWLRGDDEGGRQCRGWHEEQAPSGGGERDAFRGTGRATPQNG